jgi:hypothetical protein
MDDSRPVGGTKWWTLRVDEMWSMIERHDGAAHQHVIGGWRRSYELVLQHLSDVRRYRDRLASAWPPERSAASAAYLERLDALIASLWDSYQAAVENHRALTGATGALDSARRVMAEINREYTANEVRLAEYREAIRVHHAVGGKARGLPPRMPVDAGRQAELEQRARMVMSGLSTELAQAQVSLVKPQLYEVPSGAGGDRPFRSGAPLPGTAPSIAVNGSRSPAASTPPANARPPETAPAKPIPQKVFTGPVLGGFPAPSPRNGAGERAVPPGAIGGQASGPIAGRPGPSKSGASTTGSPLRSRLFPKNGVIGSPGAGHTRPSGSPGAGQTGPIGSPGAGQAGPIRDTVQRVNPVGGLIGGPGVSPRPAVSTLRDRGRTRTPDSTWVVRHGIDPVIHPSSPPDFDPGPVIGLER